MNTTKPSQNASARLTLISIISLIGVGISAYQSYLFYQIRSGTGAFKSICNLGEAMNCDAVMASPWAELIAGIPLSSFAAGWFLAIFFVSLILRDPSWRRGGREVALAMTGFAALMTVFYFVVMVGSLKTFCLFCLLTDAVALTLFGIVISIRPEEPKAVMDFSRWRTGGVVALISLFVMIVLRNSSDQMKITRSHMNDMYNSVMSSRDYAVDVRPGDIVMGPENAPVTIVEFSDFQCPFCRLGAIMMNNVMNRFPDKVRVVFKNFPLDPACNPEVKRSVHPLACEAAKVAHCAHRQGKFKPVYEKIFENQKELNRESLRRFAEEEGISEQELSACIDSPETQEAIGRDIREGVQLGVQSTPTFYINGKKMEGMAPLPVWSDLINTLANQAQR